jgi:hypothetical protein
MFEVLSIITWVFVLFSVLGVISKFSAKWIKENILD